MRLGLEALLALVVLAPAAHACSLAYQPFQAASFEDGALWYVDGSSLRRQDGIVDTVVEDAFFLSFAVLPGDGLLVAGQEGLGADCSGDDWLEMRDGGEVRWQRDGPARVFAHPEGPFVQMGRRLFALDGRGELPDDPFATLPEDAWILGWTTDGEPVLRMDGGVRFGDRSLGLQDAGAEPAVARHAGSLGVLEVLWGSGAPRGVALHVVDGDRIRNVSWDPGEAWGADLAWAGGWLAAAGGRAYLVAGGVHDLGVADARAVGARGGQGVVFTDDGYVVFDGTEPVEAWQRGGQGNVWRPVAPSVSGAGEVPSQQEEDGRVTTSAPTRGNDPTGSDDTFTIPGPGLALAAAALAAVAVARRR